MRMLSFQTCREIESLLWKELAGWYLPHEYDNCIIHQGRMNIILMHADVVVISSNRSINISNPGNTTGENKSQASTCNQVRCPFCDTQKKIQTLFHYLGIKYFIFPSDTWHVMLFCVCTAAVPFMLSLLSDWWYLWQHHSEWERKRTSGATA